MTEKRFTLNRVGRERIIDGIIDNETDELLDNQMDFCERLNALHEENQQLKQEKEDWKHNCIKQINENSILWNEISIMREQGAEPSDAFKEYIDSISTEYEKFWNRKKEKAREDMVIRND